MWHINSKFKKYNAILHVNDIKETYNSFNRNTKRKLQDNDIFNLDIYKENNIDKFYSMVIKKSIRNIYE